MKNRMAKKREFFSIQQYQQTSVLIEQLRNLKTQSVFPEIF